MKYLFSNKNKNNNCRMKRKITKKKNIERQTDTSWIGELSIFLFFLQV